MRIVSFRLFQALAESRAKVPETLLMRQLISVSIDAFKAILQLRYTQLLIFLMYLSPRLIVGGKYVSWFKTLFF